MIRVVVRVNGIDKAPSSRYSPENLFQSVFYWLILVEGKENAVEGLRLAMNTQISLVPHWFGQLEEVKT